jgi:hypothetical protein
MPNQTTIIVNPAPILDTLQTIRTGQTKLDDLAGALRDIAKKLDDGALQGQAGQALSEGINTKLIKAVQALTAKLGEIDQDATAAEVLAPASGVRARVRPVRVRRKRAAHGSAGGAPEVVQ